MSEKWGRVGAAGEGVGKGSKGVPDVISRVPGAA